MSTKDDRYAAGAADATKDIADGLVADATIGEPLRFTSRSGDAAHPEQSLARSTPLRDLLGSLEWSGLDELSGMARCPSCYFLDSQDRNHSDTCALAAALRDLEACSETSRGVLVTPRADPKDPFWHRAQAWCKREWIYPSVDRPRSLAEFLAEVRAETIEACAQRARLLGSVCIAADIRALTADEKGEVAR